MKKIEDTDPANLYEKMKDVMVLDIKSTIIPIPYIGDRSATVTYETEELIALCPMTGLPDFYKVEIEYIPKHTMPELKSLKMYFYRYLTMRISHEHLATKIVDDFRKMIIPSEMTLKLTANIRGGIQSTVVIN